MKIIKTEKIYLSQEEISTWTNFDQILTGIEKGCDDPDITSLVGDIQNLLSDLWSIVEEEII